MRDRPLPLSICCPHCRTYLAHPVLRSIPTHCTLPVQAARWIDTALGRATTFRATERRCLACTKSFRCAELPQDDLFALAAAFADLMRSRQASLEDPGGARASPKLP